MKTFLKGTLALALMASASGAVLAQDAGEHRRWGPGGAGGIWRGQGGEGQSRGDWQGRRGGDGGQAPPVQPEQPAPQVQPQWDGQRRGSDAGRVGQDWRAREGRPADPQIQQPAPAPQWSGERRGPSGDGGERRQWEGRRSWEGHRDDDRRVEGARRWSDSQAWSRERPRYDRRYYPPVYRTPQRFHAPFYRPPYGYYARNWGFGDVLPRGWYGQDYRILDWWVYDLPIPPVGYDWVRIGDDAVLIDSFTGRVVQVVYDLFW